MCFAFITYGLCNLPITVEAFFKYAVFFFFFFDIDIVHYSMLLFRPSSLQTFSPPVCEATSPGTSQASSTLQSMYFSFICQFISHRYVNVFLNDMLMYFSSICQCISHRYLSSYNLSNTHLHITAVVNNNTPKGGVPIIKMEI